jgi:tRNA U34 5-carboxymethylaminomethyl modifying GTPase MnmE/TrmE
MNIPSFEDIEKNFFNLFGENMPNKNGCINIALVGKVSSGKSSLLNALLCRDRNDPLAEVRARSGVQQKVS